MTYEEVIENLKYLISDECTDHADDFAEEIAIAISALERRISKKPNDIGRLGGYKVGACPVCGEGTNYDLRFCHKCGQALDWEVV